MEFVITSLGGGGAWNFYCARNKPRHLALINIPFFMQFRNGPGWVGHPHLLRPPPRQYSDDHREGGTDVALCDCLPCPSRPIRPSLNRTGRPPPDACFRRRREAGTPHQIPLARLSSLAVCQWSRTFNFSKYTVPPPPSPSSLPSSFEREWLSVYRSCSCCRWWRWE